ncbi:MAG TPA: ABC transporter permease subunit [Candidatus Limnocylindrales bacterium]|nr:ABC transporter permease subunit [Candidatus Limnocylindrales bacterium]
MNLLDVIVTIASVTARSLLGRRRSILMLLLAGAPVLLGLLVRIGGTRSGALPSALEGLVVSAVLPLVALVFGTAALGSELDDGTAVHVLTKPIPRWAIVLPKFVVAGGMTAVLLFPATILAGILVGGLGSRELGLTFAFAIAVLIGSFVYSAIFVALSAATSRGLVIGLGYSLLWEGLLSGALKGTQLFSVREYIRGMASTLAPRGAIDSLVGANGFLFAAVAIVVITALASWRLARYEIRAAE